MSYLLNLDHQIFKLLNSVWTHPLLDSFFLFWTDLQKQPIFFMFLLPAIVLAAFHFYRGKGLAVLFGATLTTSVADKLFGSLVKDLFQRPRPEFSGLQEVIVRGASQGGFSFPSSHAVDAFALISFIAFFFPRAKWLYPLAFLTAYSRVYCGYHFPSDVLIGAGLGSIFGWACAKIIDLAIKRRGLL